MPSAGLVILEPLDGAVVTDQFVVIRGLAQPGATIARVVPFWFDEHVIADASGRWTFPASLARGANTFEFRVADDVSTTVTLTIIYDPAL